MGASFEAELAGAIAEVTMREGRALGYTNLYAPIVDLARGPRWGWVVECLGENPYHVTELGVRIAKAIRAGGVAATAKPCGEQREHVRSEPAWVYVFSSCPAGGALSRLAGRWCGRKK